MKTLRFPGLLFIIICLLNFSCGRLDDFREDFNSINDRVWISPNLLSIPLESWKVENGRLECTGDLKNMKVVVLTHQLQNEGDFLINIRMGLKNEGESEGSGGIAIGLKDETDMNIKSLAYFGTGLNAGVNTSREIFLGESSQKLPDEFDIGDFVLHLDGYKEDGKYIVRLEATDIKGISTEKIKKTKIESVEGAISLVNNHPDGNKYSGDNQFWFDDFNFSGSAIVINKHDSFGPILWSMYTVSRGTMKMSVQMPPLSEDDNKEVELHFLDKGVWILADTQPIEPLSRTVVFKKDDWDNTIEKKYQVKYIEKKNDGSYAEYIHEGVIKAEPTGRPLVLGGLTCQYHYGFPYSPLVSNLESSNPDILYFSGDQIYESNGGYGIKRFPADSAILNYLGKWYMFGWAFGDLMKNRPTICIPDDHDVFQGNLWGDGGKNIPLDTFTKYQGTSGGYVEPFEMVNAVHRTQTGHLPDCFDPSPMEQGINPYYTELLYGRVSFAITGDRMFKSGPKEIAFWDGRKDHLKTPLKNLGLIDRKDLKLLGDRQILFLENWARDWTGADMKCLLSQTIFTNVATHHGGNKMVLHADLDSGGWPIGPRNKVVGILKSCGAFHIAGDQHLPTLVQYGIKSFQDAGWAFCTPAIAVGYQRRFMPEALDLKITDPPAHGNANTGKYKDPFGHPSYVYAVGNPEDETGDRNRYQRAQKSSSGFGLIHFDTENRTIKCEAIRFLADLKTGDSSTNQFPGWPHTIKQIENFGLTNQYRLDTVYSFPEKEYLNIFSEKTEELIYSYRPKEANFIPWINKKGLYRVQVINEECGEIREIRDIKSK